MAIDYERILKEDLTIIIGIGATYRVGSDSYPYYISEILPNGIYGLYSPKSHFKKSWTDGTMIVDPFDTKQKSTMYIKRYYGNWYEVDITGKRRRRLTTKYSHLNFGKACSYRDPSF